MKLAELVARLVGDERRPSAVIVVRPSAHELASMFTGAPVRAWDEHLPDHPETRTVVEVVAAGEEEQQVSALSALLGDTDVALLLFSQPPELFPVGIVTDTLTRHHLTVLEACATSHRRGRTALAVTRDAERRQRGYLTGNAIPDGEASDLRQRNEWLVEGLQTRAYLQLLERRLAGQEAELALARTERRRLEQELTEASELSARLKVLGAELSATQKALGASERELAASQKAVEAAESSLVVARRAMAPRPSRVQKATRLLADDPVRGSGRILRAVARRLRR